MGAKLFLLSIRAKKGHQVAGQPIDPAEKEQHHLSLDSSDLGFMLDQINPTEVAEYYGMISVDSVDLHTRRIITIIDDYKGETDLERRLGLLLSLEGEAKSLIELI